MEFGLFPESQWRALRDVQNTVPRITARTDSLVGLLISTNAEYASFQSANFTFFRSSVNLEVASVKTPFGRARIRTSWEVGATELLGVLIIERECHDQYDRLYWEPVWAMKIPAYEDPYSGTQASGPRIPIDDMYGDTRRAALFSAVVSIIVGIANGPVAL
jgi:hypothetical protein